MHFGLNDPKKEAENVSSNNSSSSGSSSNHEDPTTSSCSTSERQILFFTRFHFQSHHLIPLRDINLNLRYNSLGHIQFPGMQRDSLDVHLSSSGPGQPDSAAAALQLSIKQKIILTQEIRVGDLLTPLLFSPHLYLLLLFLFLLLVIILVVAVGDLLWSLREEVGRLDLADGAGQLVPFALHVLEVDVVAVSGGQRRLCVDDADVGVFHCGLMRHLGGRVYSVRL